MVTFPNALELIAQLLVLLYVVISDERLEIIRDKVISAYCYLDNLSIKERVLEALREFERKSGKIYGLSLHSTRIALHSLYINLLPLTILIAISLFYTDYESTSVSKGLFIMEKIGELLLDQLNEINDVLVDKSLPGIPFSLEQSRKKIENIKQIVASMSDDQLNAAIKYAYSAAYISLFVFLTIISSISTYVSFVLTRHLVRVGSRCTNFFSLSFLLVLDAVILLGITAIFLAVLILLTPHFQLFLQWIYEIAGFNDFELNLYVSAISIAYFDLYNVLWFSPELIQVIESNDPASTRLTRVFVEFKKVLIEIQTIESQGRSVWLALFVPNWLDALSGFMAAFLAVISLDLVALLQIQLVDTAINWAIFFAALPSLLHLLLILYFVVLPLLDPVRKLLVFFLLKIENSREHTGKYVVAVVVQILVVIVYFLRTQ